MSIKNIKNINNRNKRLFLLYISIIINNNKVYGSDFKSICVSEIAKKKNNSMHVVEDFKNDSNLFDEKEKNLYLDDEKKKYSKDNSSGESTIEEDYGHYLSDFNTERFLSNYSSYRSYIEQNKKNISHDFYSFKNGGIEKKRKLIKKLYNNTNNKIKENFLSLLLNDKNDILLEINRIKDLENNIKNVCEDYFSNKEKNTIIDNDTKEKNILTLGILKAQLEVNINDFCKKYNITLKNDDKKENNDFFFFLSQYGNYINDIFEFNPSNDTDEKVEENRKNKQILEKIRSLSNKEEKIRSLIYFLNVNNGNGFDIISIEKEIKIIKELFLQSTCFNNQEEFMLFLKIITNKNNDNNNLKKGLKRINDILSVQGNNIEKENFEKNVSDVFETYILNKFIDIPTLDYLKNLEKFGDVLVLIENYKNFSSDTAENKSKVILSVTQNIINNPDKNDSMPLQDRILLFIKSFQYYMKKYNENKIKGQFLSTIFNNINNINKNISYDDINKYIQCILRNPHIIYNHKNKINAVEISNFLYNLKNFINAKLKENNNGLQEGNEFAYNDDNIITEHFVKEVEEKEKQILYNNENYDSMNLSNKEQNKTISITNIVMEFLLSNDQYTDIMDFFLSEINNNIVTHELLNYLKNADQEVKHYFLSSKEMQKKNNILKEMLFRYDETYNENDKNDILSILKDVEFWIKVNNNIQLNEDDLEYKKEIEKNIAKKIIINPSSFYIKDQKLDLTNIKHLFNHCDIPCLNTSLENLFQELQYLFSIETNDFIEKLNNIYCIFDLENNEEIFILFKEYIDNGVIRDNAIKNNSKTQNVLEEIERKYNICFKSLIDSLIVSKNNLEKIIKEFFNSNRNEMDFFCFN